MKRLFILFAVFLQGSVAYSAQQTHLSTDTGGQMRTKLNANATELYGAISGLEDSKAAKASTVMLWSAWPIGTTWTTDHPPVAYGGVIYKCIAEYTTVTDDTPDDLIDYFEGIGTATGDNLGSASASDVAALFSGTGEYLKADGTKGTPSGTGAVDSVNGETGVVVLDADDIDDTSTTNKFVTAAEKSGWDGKEDSLGNPSTNGYVLSSTTAGVRSWIEMTGGGTGIAHATADGNYYASKDGGWANLANVFQSPLVAGTDYLTPTGSAANLTDFPTLNQNTTGTAAGLTSQYIDWSASSGGNSIANKPTIPTLVSQLTNDSGFITSETDDQTAAEVTVDASGFSGNLSTSDTTVQAALATINSMSVDSGISHATSDGSYYASKDGAWASLTGVFQPYDTNMISWPSAISATEVGYLDGLTEALPTTLAAKANASNISFVAGALSDMKIVDTAEPTDGTQWLLDTISYGDTDDNLHLWSIEKIGSLLAGKIAATDITYENLNTNGDVGTGASQVAAGDHTHSGVYEPAGITESDISDFGTTVYIKTAIDTQSEVETIWAVNLTNTIASGTATLGTSEIADGACASVVTVSATGVLTTDVINPGFNGTPVGVTGYDPTGTPLNIIAYPTANNVNFLVCNSTGAAVTPGSLTINWRVDR